MRRADQFHRFLLARPLRTWKELAEEFGLGQTAVYREIGRLKKEGRIREATSEERRDLPMERGKHLVQYLAVENKANGS